MLGVIRSQAMSSASPSFVFDPASLPSPPAVVMRLARLMADPEAHLRDIIDPLRTDASLCAQVLAVCNSVVNQRGQSVSSIEGAVIRLGYAELNRIVCATAFRYVFNGAVSLYNETADVLWHRSVYTAVAMEELTDSPAGQDEAYLAGLLHLSGVFLVSKVYPHEGEPRIDVNALDEARDEEMALLGIRSCEVGAMALTAWGLSERVCLAVRHQHDPENAGDASDLAERLRVAARLGVQATARRGAAKGVLVTRDAPAAEDPLHDVAVRAGKRARVLLR